MNGLVKSKVNPGTYFSYGNIFSHMIFPGECICVNQILTKIHKKKTSEKSDHESSFIRCIKYRKKCAHRLSSRQIYLLCPQFPYNQIRYEVIGDGVAPTYFRMNNILSPLIVVSRSLLQDNALTYTVSNKSSCSFL